MTDTNGTNGPDGQEGANLAGQQDASSSSIDANALFNALKDVPEFKEFVKSNAQSKHDKRLNKIEKNQASLSEKFAAVDQLMEGGLSRDLAIQWYEMQEAQAQGLPKGSFTDGGQAEVSGGTKTDGGQEDKAFEQIAQSMGFDPNGPEVLLVRREGGTAFEKAQKLASLKAQNKPVEPNPASTMTTQTGPPANQGDLMTQYEKERDAIGMGKPWQINQLKRKYREKGLDIW